MLLPNSRYKKTQLFKPSDTASGAFSGLRPRLIGPATGVIEHVVCEGDRLDQIARHYYNDDRLWWRIIDANPQIIFGGGLMPVQDQRPNKIKGDNDAGGDSKGQTDDSLVGQIILIPRAQET
jgi:hypothetical protein